MTFGLKHMYQEKVQVLWNKKVGPVYYKIGLKCNRGYLNANPGQFVMLHLTGQNAPLLRRPFSIHQLIINKETIEGFEILYKVIGECTQKLSGLKTGDIVDIIGPLGNGFTISDNFNCIYLAAGGIGVAPILFMASFLKKKNVDLLKCKVFNGGRTKTDLLCVDDFNRLGIKVYATTDDGSAGDKGLVTHPLEIEVKKDRPDIIVACGPLEMLKSVVSVAESHSVPCQISIETIMACGIGACLGCAVEIKETQNKYKHACTDGPVFDAKTLKLDSTDLVKS